MSLVRTLNQAVPGPVRRPEWRGYACDCDQWSNPTVGCRAARRFAAGRVPSSVHSDGIILSYDGREVAPRQARSQSRYDMLWDRSPTIKVLLMAIGPLQSLRCEPATLPKMMQIGPIARQSVFV